MVCFALLSALLPLSLVKSYLIFWYPLRWHFFLLYSWLEVIIDTSCSCGTRTTWDGVSELYEFVRLFVVQYSKLRATRRPTDTIKWCKKIVSRKGELENEWQKKTNRKEKERVGKSNNRKIQLIQNKLSPSFCLSYEIGFIIYTWWISVCVCVVFIWWWVWTFFLE